MTNSIDISLGDEIEEGEEWREEGAAEGIPSFDVANLSYDEFFHWFMLKNKPVILKNVTDGWPCSELWVKGDTLDVDYFSDNFPRIEVPVSNCGRRTYNVQEKCDTLMMDYLDYWRNYKKGDEDLDCLYLKDWHFTKCYPKGCVYTVPVHFASDWLNEYYDRNPHLNDDYRFAYIGPKGSWTPFHVDVFTSFSWSANVCGRKRWILFPPGVEECFRDGLGNVKYDIDASDVESLRRYPIFEIIQEKGDAIFVPSGWYHQVWNLEDTISINHNWINGCNVRHVWKSLRESMRDVKEEISDCRDMENWEDQCQLVLSSSFGFDYRQFYEFLSQLATDRMEKLRKRESLRVSESWDLGRNHIIFDLRRIYSVVKSMVDDSDFQLLEMNRNEGKSRQFLNDLRNFLNDEA